MVDISVSVINYLPLKGYKAYNVQICKLRRGCEKVYPEKLKKVNTLYNSKESLKSLRKSTVTEMDVRQMSHYHFKL